MKVFDFWVDRSWLDWVAIVILGALSLKFGLIEVLPNDQAPTLQTMNSIAIGMIGLGAVVATLIVTTTPSESLQSAMHSSGDEFMGQIFGCIYAFMLCIVLFLIPVLDISWVTDSKQNAIFIFTSALLVLRSIRILVLLRIFLKLLT